DYTEAIRLDPQFVPAYAGRALAYRALGDQARAASDEYQARELCRAANEKVATAYIDKGQYDNAIAICTEAMRGDPANPKAYGLRGLAHYLQGKHDNAITDLTEELRLSPDRSGSYALRGEAYVQTGKYDQAIADCTEAIRLDPQFAFAY